MNKVTAPECLVKKERLLAALETLDQIPVRMSLPTSVYVKATPIGGSKLRLVRLFLSAEIAGYVDVAPTAGKWPFDKTVWLDRRLLFSFCLAARQIKGKSDFTFKILNGELLIPQRESASESRVGFVTVHAEIGARTGDRRFASPAQIVHADYVPGKLS